MHCSSWGRKKSDVTEWLNWSELNLTSSGTYSVWKGRKKVRDFFSWTACPKSRKVEDGLPRWLTCQCRRHGFDLWSRKIPWRREWQPTEVFLPGKSYGQRSLVGYRPWGWKESDTTERLTHTHTHSHTPLGKVIVPVVVGGMDLISIDTYFMASPFCIANKPMVTFSAGIITSLYRRGHWIP